MMLLSLGENALHGAGALLHRAPYNHSPVAQQANAVGRHTIVTPETENDLDIMPKPLIFLAPQFGPNWALGRTGQH